MATKIKIKNLPIGYQSIISNGTHSIVGDEPLDKSGTNLGFSPGDLLLSSLALCKVAAIRYIANKNGWMIGDVDAELTMVVGRGENHSLQTEVETVIHIEGDISQSQKEILLKEADNCHITRILQGNWNLKTAIDLEKK